MAQIIWKVKLYEVAVPFRTPPATFIETFGVTADGHDAAKSAARKWLEEKGRKVRAISFATEPNEMVAYVLPKDAKPPVLRA